MLWFCSCLETKHVQLILAMFRPQCEGAPVHHRKVDDTHVEVNQCTAPGSFRHVATSQSERKKRLKPLKSHKKHCNYEPNLWYNLHFAVSPLTYSDVGHIWPHMATYGHIQPLPLFCGKPSWLCPKKVLFATKQSATQLPSLAIWLEHPWRSSRHRKRDSRCCARSETARHQLDPWQCQRCPKWKSQSARSPQKRPPSSPRRKRAH